MNLDLRCVGVYIVSCLQDTFARARTRPKVWTKQPLSRALARRLGLGYLVYKRINSRPNGLCWYSLLHTCMQDTFARATHSAGQARRATIRYLVYKLHTYWSFWWPTRKLFSIDYCLMFWAGAYKWFDYMLLLLTKNIVLPIYLYTRYPIVVRYLVYNQFTKIIVLLKVLFY